MHRPADAASLCLPAVAPAQHAPQTWKALCEAVPRLNVALRQDAAKREIAKSSVELLAGRRTSLTRYGQQLTPAAQKFMADNEVVALQLLDYANLNGDPTSMLRQLSGKNGCIWDVDNNRRLEACPAGRDISNPQAPAFSDLLTPLIRTKNWRLNTADVLRRLENVLSLSKTCANIALKPVDKTVLAGEFASASGAALSAQRHPCLSALVAKARLG